MLSPIGTPVGIVGCKLSGSQSATAVAAAGASDAVWLRHIRQQAPTAACSHWIGLTQQRRSVLIRPR